MKFGCGYVHILNIASSAICGKYLSLSVYCSGNYVLLFANCRHGKIVVLFYYVWITNLHILIVHMTCFRCTNVLCVNYNTSVCCIAIFKLVSIVVVTNVDSMFVVVFKYIFLSPYVPEFLVGSVEAGCLDVKTFPTPDLCEQQQIPLCWLGAKPMSRFARS